MKDIQSLDLYAKYLLRAFVTIVTAIVCTGLIAFNVTDGALYAQVAASGRHIRGI
jgi:hypothetical protein